MGHECRGLHAKRHVNLVHNGLSHHFAPSAAAGHQRCYWVRRRMPMRPGSGWPSYHADL